MEKGVAAMRESQTQIEGSSTVQVLFPMAVGAIFLFVLVMGALLG
jgi:hypothetical protein